jgi:hypothetical protein
MAEIIKWLFGYPTLNVTVKKEFYQNLSCYPEAIKKIQERH